MESGRGCGEAKRLLRERFGDDLLVASAYQEKALQWPNIRTEDSSGLQDYALFMRGCANAMIDVKALDDMNTATHLRTCYLKLPMKLREKWRVIAWRYQDRTKKRADFLKLVDFIEEQAKMANDPLFGNILDPRTPTPRFTPKEEKSSPVYKRSSFATVAETTKPHKNTESAAPTSAICIFCKENHKLETCKKFTELAVHEDKLTFLKERGMCFGCLKRGHMSNTCEEKMTCQVCSYPHPTVLHMKWKPKETEKTPDKKVTSGSIATKLGCNAQTGAGAKTVALAIIPVKIRLADSEQVIETYAFLDPGSTSTFCTDALQDQLHATGVPTEVLLCTMSHEKPVRSQIVSGLEISSLDGDEFFKLPETLSQPKIPVTHKHIPTEEAVRKWTYLERVQVPVIDADIGLLIGNDAHVIQEPLETIPRQGNGPYATRTALGWVVYGLGNSPSPGQDAVYSNCLEVTKLAPHETQVAPLAPCGKGLAPCRNQAAPVVLGGTQVAPCRTQVVPCVTQPAFCRTLTKCTTQEAKLPMEIADPFKSLRTRNVRIFRNRNGRTRSARRLSTPRAHKNVETQEEEPCQPFHRPKIPNTNRSRGWIKEYLPSMQSRSKWTPTQENFKNASIPSVSWLIDRELRIRVGSEAHIRGVLPRAKSRTQDW